MRLGPLGPMGPLVGGGNAPDTSKDQLKSGRRAMHPLSKVNPQMMQQVLSIRGLSDGRMAEYTHGKGNHTPVSAESEALCNHKDMVGSLSAEKHYSLPSMLQQWPSLVNSPGEGAFPSNQTAISRPASLIESGNGDGKQFPPNPQLTIFYNGMVNVYNISAQKAKAIMMLAENIMDSPQQNPAANAITAASSDLPIARKQSLQRFLEKRKSRLNSAAPYGTELSSKHLPKDGLSAKDKEAV